MKFSLVGAIGIAVQLGGLALLHHWRVNYLIATAVAVEAAVLHNFAWHERYTWKDRSHGTGWQGALSRLLRFHVANAFISLTGNLLLMRLLVGELGLTVLPANMVSVASCGLANFLVSDRWVFLARGPSGGGVRAAVGHEQ